MIIDDKAAHSGLLCAYSPHGLEAGCDEAGRGCLAGPVFAAAVVLPRNFHIPGLQDSKKISAAQREGLRPVIESQALAWAVARVDPEIIDEINILQASFRAMHLALDRLSLRPGLILVDGNRFPGYENIPYKTVVGGDGIYASIAAASVLAKTHRDAYMLLMDRDYPHYEWRRNKGYGTKRHRWLIQVHGPSPVHRKSFRWTEVPDPTPNPLKGI